MRVLSGLVLAASLMLGRSEALRGVSDSDKVVPAGSRIPASEFSVRDVWGKEIRLGDYKGRVVLLDFWATTCGGCKVELPWYVAFDAAYREQGLAVIGLDMYGETSAVIKPFVAKWKMRYPIAVGTDAIGEKFGLREMPLTVLIDRKGRVALAHAGVVNREEFERAIRVLLRE